MKDKKNNHVPFILISMCVTQCLHSKGKNVSVGSFELIKELYLLRTRAVIHNQNELRYNSFPFLKDLDELSFEN